MRQLLGLSLRACIEYIVTYTKLLLVFLLKTS